MLRNQLNFLFSLSATDFYCCTKVALRFVALDYARRSVSATKFTLLGKLHVALRFLLVVSGEKGTLENTELH